MAHERSYGGEEAFQGRRTGFWGDAARLFVTMSSSVEEGCHCAFHGVSWMSRDMDGRLVGATTALHPVGMDGGSISSGGRRQGWMSFQGRMSGRLSPNGKSLLVPVCLTAIPALDSCYPRRQSVSLREAVIGGLTVWMSGNTCGVDCIMSTLCHPGSTAQKRMTKLI